MSELIEKKLVNQKISLEFFFREFFRLYVRIMLFGILIVVISSAVGLFFLFLILP